MASSTKPQNVFGAEDEGVIPSVPTRAEELAYLDKLEKELRNRPQSAKYYPPDPSRRYRYKIDNEAKLFKRDHMLKKVLGGVLLAPVAFWLTM